MILDDGIVLDCGVLPNDEMLDVIQSEACGRETNVLALEMVASYGMAVGAEVFETCVWIGRFKQTWQACYGRANTARMVYRKDVKLALCGTAKAKDANIRQALIDLYGGEYAIGKKAKPGPLYRVKSHAWAALAVAVTAAGGAR